MKHTLSAVAALALLALAGPAAADDFVVLCNRANPVASLDVDALRGLFTGRTKVWDGGAVVQAVVIPSDAAPETRFLATLLGMTGRELLSRMQQEVFRGEMRRPVVIRSSQECVAALRVNPGGVCIAVAAAAAALPAEVQVVRLSQ